MSMQNFSYHTHTNFSDGRNTVLEMVRQAKKLGFCELGISDHLSIHKNMQKSLSYPLWKQRGNSHIFRDNFQNSLSEFQKHCEEIRKISKAEKIKLYVGFEVDYFTYDGWLDELKDFLSQLDYDYVLTGNHMLFDEKCENIFDLYDLPFLYSDIKIQQEFLHRHFVTIKKAVESGVFKFLAHIDYARKLGDAICAADMFKKEKQDILAALQKNKVALEISTKGLRKINDFYPCQWILAESSELKIPFVISDDAHATNELGYKFELAEETLQKYKIFNRLKF